MLDEASRVRVAEGAGADEQPPVRILTAPLAPLALHSRRAVGAVVGRPVELGAIQQELDGAARGRFLAVTLEGEPGIGKTRLVLATAEVADAKGFVPIVVTGDEELRGPFLLARSILASEAAQEAAARLGAGPTLERALDAMSGRQEEGLEALPPEQKLLRTFDLAALALRELATASPVALLVDDLQWADEDSLRMLRYVARTAGASPIFLMLAIRPEETALVNEAVTLIADMERMGLVRRLRLQRFTQVDTTSFLAQLLGGRVDPATAATMHGQAEGVPFIVEELARTYRDTGLLQLIDGTWTVGRNAERLVPSAVRTLIQRRASRLPDNTKATLAEGAVLGRSFSLRDLRAIRNRTGDEAATPESLTEDLAPAVQAGLVLQHNEGAAADYSFNHEQVRQFSLATLPGPRRREIHAAIVDLLTTDAEPLPASLPLLAHHALAAGDTERAAHFSIAAARNALASNAPEEVLRVVEQALPAASAAQDRVALLMAQDQALEMLNRSAGRLERLAELGALAEALGDGHMVKEIQLRRAAALRVSEEYEAAAEIARQIRDRAREEGDARAELAACLELGQDLLQTSLGEAYSPTGTAEGFDGAEEAYARAVALAEDIGDDPSLAAALRELGTISFARARDWFINEIRAGRGLEFYRRIVAGETADDMLPTLPIAPLIQSARERFERALEAFERVGDRRGVMSTVIAMAYVRWGTDIHLSSSAQRIEEIRRLASRMKALTTESERTQTETQMLFGVHVFGHAKIVMDLALARGTEAYRSAKVDGDHAIEFLAARGVALCHLDLGEIDRAEEWAAKAAAAAAAAPTALRARDLESLRGMVRAAGGDAAGMREHLGRAVQLATEQGRPAARCEALARFALEASRLGADRDDGDLLDAAEQAATDVIALGPVLPGHPPWVAQSHAALARIHQARGDLEAAVASARAAIDDISRAFREDNDLDIYLPVSRALLAGGTDEERTETRAILQLTLLHVAQRTLDEEVRVRWLRGPVGRELAELAGPLERMPAGPGKAEGEALSEDDLAFLRLLTEGSTNAEIAEALGISQEMVTRRLGEILARTGASSRAEATTYAFRVV